MLLMPLTTITARTQCQVYLNLSRVGIDPQSVLSQRDFVILATDVVVLKVTVSRGISPFAISARQAGAYSHTSCSLEDCIVDHSKLCRHRSPHPLPRGSRFCNK